jgi:hypothetical protein
MGLKGGGGEGGKFQCFKQNKLVDYLPEFHLGNSVNGLTKLLKKTLSLSNHMYHQIEFMD